MKDKEIIILLNKLRSENINLQELEELTHLLARKRDLTHLLKDMGLSYQQVVDSTNLLKYAHADLTRKRLMQSINYSAMEELPKVKRRIRPWHYAAVLLLITTCVGIFYTRHNTEEEIVWQSVETMAGQKKQLTLADGTSVQLNGNSIFRFTNKQHNGYRLVHLDGEAVFDVAKDTEHPFIIISKNFTTQVVGTSFNLDTDIESSISVTSGVVNVVAMEADKVLADLTKNHKAGLSHPDRPTAWMDKLPHTIAKITLTKGQKAQLNALKTWEELPFSEKSWTGQQLVLFDEPMDQVVQKLNRSYGIPVALSENVMKNRITITFENKRHEQILNTLAELCGAKLTKDGDKWKINK